MVGFKTGYHWYEVGSGDIIVSFFSTVIVQLEKNQRGALYPALVKELFWGYLPVEHIGEALRELFSIALYFKEMPVDQFIWDSDDLSSKPSADFVYNKNANNLAEFYITHDGKDLMDVMLKALNKAAQINKPLEIKFIDNRFTTIFKF